MALTFPERLDIVYSIQFFWRWKVKPSAARKGRFFHNYGSHLVPYPAIVPSPFRLYFDLHSSAITSCS